MMNSVKISLFFQILVWAFCQINLANAQNIKPDYSNELPKMVLECGNKDISGIGDCVAEITLTGGDIGRLNLCFPQNATIVRQRTFISDPEKSCFRGLFFINSAVNVPSICENIKRGYAKCVTEVSMLQANEVEYETYNFYNDNKIYFHTKKGVLGEKDTSIISFPISQIIIANTTSFSNLNIDDIDGMFQISCGGGDINKFRTKLLLPNYPPLWGNSEATGFSTSIKQETIPVVSADGGTSLIVRDGISSALFFREAVQSWATRDHKLVSASAIKIIGTRDISFHLLAQPVANLNVSKSEVQYGKIVSNGKDLVELLESIIESKCEGLLTTINDLSAKKSSENSNTELPKDIKQQTNKLIKDVAGWNTDTTKSLNDDSVRCKAEKTLSNGNIFKMFSDTDGFLRGKFALALEIIEANQISSKAEHEIKLAFFIDGQQRTSWTPRKALKSLIGTPIDRTLMNSIKRGNSLLIAVEYAETGFRFEQKVDLSGSSKAIDAVNQCANQS